MIEGFSFAKTPRILFGADQFARLGEVVAALGSRAAVLTGGQSLKASGKLDEALGWLEQRSVRSYCYTVRGEPSPDLVDGMVAELRRANVDVIVAIGGGSVLDAGKAVSAMRPTGEPIRDYLEVVGTRTPDGRKVPFVAVPTTAGTGSEATMNAVISEVGPDGFKASLRHPNFVPDVALVDPALSLSCPPGVTAACGMDAFTQLLESYVSTQASPMTDALAYSGLELACDALVAACTTGAADINVRAAMAYAALLSGITLANAGLGVVHGIAGVIGGFFDVPHGVACGTLIAPATRMSIEKLRTTGGDSLAKYAAVGRLFGGRATDVNAACDTLIETLTRWTDELRIPRLGTYGIGPSDVETVAARAGNKNNPIALSRDEIAALMTERL